MNHDLLAEMERQCDLSYYGLTADLPRSRRAKRDLVKAKAIMFGPQGVDFSGGTEAAKGRGPSRNIWGQFNVANIRMDPSLGQVEFDDFSSFGGTVTTKVGTYASCTGGGYKSYEETSGTLRQLTYAPVNTTIPNQQRFGVIELATTSSTSNTVAMEAGYGIAGSMAITGNVLPRVAFEARVAINKTAVTGLDTFIGLCETGGATNQFLISSSDAMNQKTQIGFYSLTAAPTTIVATYGKNGSAAVVPTQITAGAYVAPVSSVTQFTKLGFVYDPSLSPYLRYYQDGVLMATVADCSASTFPTGLVVTPLIYLQSDASAAAVVKFDMDWWAWGVSFV